LSECFLLTDPMGGETDLPPFSAQSIIRHSPGILLPLNRGKSQAAARREP
jgi:hypothetical protein